MNRLIAFKKYILWVIPILFAFSFTGMILCLLYSRRHWNAMQFETFYAHWDFFIAYLLESIGLALFFIVFLISTKKCCHILRKAISIFSFSILCAGSLAVIITIITNCIGLNRVIQDYKLDCQLESDNQELFQEAIDALIPQCHITSNFEEPNPFIQKAARNGYSKAQNAMGCFYHRRATIALSNAEYKADGSSHHNLIQQSETDFDHAIYWFLKAAQNRHGVSQTNLGRIFMGNLASNRCPDIDIAKQWLLKAVQNGDNDAYYYLGVIYSKENLRDAYVYWSKGTEYGDERCARELEKPEFAMGIPADSLIVITTSTDTIP